MAEHTNLAQALAAFQAELPKLTKDETAKVKGETKDGRSYDRSYGYADLAQVVETILPVLGKHGLSITSKTTFQDGNFMLEVSLLHEGGERETGYWPLPDPRRAGPQDIGSAITYGRRYLKLALTGAYPGGEDDDGAKAQSAPRDSWDNARPAARPVSAPPAPPAKTSWTDEEVYGFQVKIATGELDKAVAGYDWMAGKDLHNRKVSGQDDTQVQTATEVLATRLANEALEPDAMMAEIKNLQALASNRGLMKVQVSGTETLAEALFAAQELAQHAADQAALEPTPGAAGSSND